MATLETYIDNDAYASIARIRETKQDFDAAEHTDENYFDRKLTYAQNILNVKLNEHYKEEPLETTWSGFAESVLDVHPDYATRLAKWAYVYDILMAATGSAPSTPYTARPFAKLAPCDMIQAWTGMQREVGEEEISYTTARDYIRSM